MKTRPFIFVFAIVGFLSMAGCVHTHHGSHTGQYTHTKLHKSHATPADFNSSHAVESKVHEKIEEVRVSHVAPTASPALPASSLPVPNRRGWQVDRSGMAPPKNEPAKSFEPVDRIIRTESVETEFRTHAAPVSWSHPANHRVVRGQEHTSQVAHYKPEHLPALAEQIIDTQPTNVALPDQLHHLPPQKQIPVREEVERIKVVARTIPATNEEVNVQRRSGWRVVGIPTYADSDAKVVRVPVRAAEQAVAIPEDSGQNQEEEPTAQTRARAQSGQQVLPGTAAAQSHRPPNEQKQQTPEQPRPKKRTDW